LLLSQPPATFTPPDRATCEQKREHEQQMRAWLFHRLEQQINQDIKAAATAMTVKNYCVRLARAGDPAPLRQLYSDLQEFIHAPKLRRGQRYQKACKVLTMPKFAAGVAKAIRFLLREQYGDVRRRRGEKAPEDFAIDFLREWVKWPEERAACATLTVEAVEAAGKPSGKHTPGPRRRAK
jgi:hypothetical protein